MTNHNSPPLKSIRLTIEWPGACSEADWAKRITEAIEECDYSHITKVVKAELLTDYGYTDPIDVPGILKPIGFWCALANRFL